MERRPDLSWLKDWRLRIFGGACIFAGFLAGMLIFGSPWHLPPAWGDIPTWITAIATVLLAVFAIVTAYYARRAFLKQSEEVSDQAKMLKVQSDQLEEQRTINALQAKDLVESLKERARLRRIAEREQADDVGFSWQPARDLLVVPSPGQPVLDTLQCSFLVIDNASRRRIVDVTCRIEPAEGDGLTLAPERTGQIATGMKIESHSAAIRNLTEGDTVPMVRAGTQFGFLLRFDLGAHPDPRLAARFTDDAGLHWQVDQDLHLQPLHDRDDW